MPFKKTYKKKRTYRRNRRYGINKSKNFVRSVQRVITRNQEKKYHVSSGDWTATNATAAIAQITNVSQGDTDTTRDGDQIYLKSVYSSWLVRTNQTVPNASSVRMIIFQWFNTNGTSPVVGDILLSTTAATVIHSPYTHDTRYQFRVLYDKTVTVVPYDDQYMETKVGPMRRLITRIPKRKLQYVAGSATQGVNQIYFLRVSDDNDSPPDVQNYFKVNFTDS